MGQHQCCQCKCNPLNTTTYVLCSQWSFFKHRAAHPSVTRFMKVTNVSCNNVAVLFRAWLASSPCLPCVDNCHNTYGTPMGLSIWCWTSSGLDLDHWLYTSNQPVFKCGCWLEDSCDVVWSTHLSYILTQSYHIWKMPFALGSSVSYAVVLHGLRQHLYNVSGYPFPSRTSLTCSSSVAPFTSWGTLHAL